MPRGLWLIVEIGALLAFLCVPAVILFNYSDLPPTIHTHFRWNGAPSGVGGKSTLLVHLLAGMTVFALLSAIPFKAAIASSAISLSRVVKLELMLLHAYLVWAMVRTAQGFREGLGAGFHTMFLAVILCTAVFGVFRSTVRRIDSIALLALIAIIGLVIRGWEPVRKAHVLTHNPLASTNIHVPTADLFLWTVCALTFYFGTKMWAGFAPHVFQLSPERAVIWRDRLRWTRLGSTLLFLALTLITLYRYGYNFN